MTRRKPQAGSALIEFAASLILLSALFTGIFQIGYTFYSYQRLENSVRAGARYASLRSNAASADDAGFTQAVRNLVVYADPAPAPGSKPLITGLAPGNVDVTVADKSTTVSIHGFELDSMFAKVKLAGRPTVTFPSAKRGPQ
jgi:Flp pilus assembly protein TadG